MTARGHISQVVDIAGITAECSIMQVMRSVISRCGIVGMLAISTRYLIGVKIEEGGGGLAIGGPAWSTPGGKIRGSAEALVTPPRISPAESPDPEKIGTSKNLGDSKMLVKCTRPDGSMVLLEHEDLGLLPHRNVYRSNFYDLSNGRNYLHQVDVHRALIERHGAAYRDIEERRCLELAHGFVSIEFEAPR